MKLIRLFSLVLATRFCFAALPQVTFYDGLKNHEVNRSVDISSQTETVTIKVNVSNIGSEEAMSYIVAFPVQKSEHLAYIKATRGTGSKKADLDVDRVVIDGLSTENAYYRISWDTPLKARKWRKFQIKVEFTHVLHPLPAEITQSQTQLMKYEGSVYFNSPYATKKQQTEFKAFSSAIESYTRHPKPIAKKGSKILAGPYVNIKPFTYSLMGIHYENTNPFITATNVVREIEVSHWGRVSIAERYDMLNSGARLTGPYSMLDQKQKRNIQKAAFRDLVVTLPKTAENVYFRDRIGNISSSNFRKTRKFSSLELRPRFTLYGGWKNDFEFGYQVPSDEFVSVNQKDKTFHKLSAPFSIPFPNAVIDNLTVKVILPEGATDIEVSLPFEVDSYTMETLFSYLDTTGRPVVVFNKKNVVDFHRQHFEVVYNFTWLAILREPFFLFTGFFIAFLVFIGLSRVSLELSVPGDEVKDIVLKSQENTVANVESDDGSFDEYRHMIVTDSDALAVAKSIVDSCDRFTSSCEDGVKRGSLSKKAEKSLPKLSEMLRQLSVIESSTKDFCSHLESIAHEMRGMVAKKNRNGLRKLAIDFNAMMNILKSS